MATNQDDLDSNGNDSVDPFAEVVLPVKGKTEQALAAARATNGTDASNPHASPINPHFALPILAPRAITSGFLDTCGELFFRQSFLKDNLDCGMMSMFRWVYGIEESQPFFSAILGTAGHAVVFTMHEQRKYDYTHLQLMDMFAVAFETEIHKLDNLPKLSAKFESWEDELTSKMPDYLDMLSGYQSHQQNKEFHSTMHEQSFVLEIPSTVPDARPYIFTGQIDQAGYYQSGDFVLRDLKFRDNAFRPGKTNFDLDLQMTVYAAALKWGNPACPECKPHYEFDEFTNKRTLVYMGPCLACNKKIGTKYWPRKFTDRCEMIWMKDFLRREKDQYQKLEINKTVPKVKKGGKMVYAKTHTDRWINGYKKGDYCGPCFLVTRRSPSQMQVLMADVLAICEQIRQGIFYRKPGEACKFWCKYTEQCVGGMKMEAEEIDLSTISHFGSEDPF